MPERQGRRRISDFNATVMEKRVYFNRPQRLTQLIAANTSVIVAGRRTGKTDSMAAPFVYRNMQRMPGSTGAIVVPTYKHGLTNTIPGILAAWRRWGLMEGVHFVVGKKPPKDFRATITPPACWEHVIALYNGSVVVIVSQDRPGSSNSLTLSWILVDEAKFIDFNKLKDETLPANGGIRSFFGKHSFNHSMMVLSDMPQTSKGSWFLHYREKMDPELIATIEGTLYEIWRLKQKVRDFALAGVDPPDYLRGHIARLDRDLNRMRSVAVYYREYSSIENLQLLGENYIRQMKRDLTPLTFQTSILCRRIGIAKDGYYSCMRERHKYDASDLGYLDSFTLGQDVDYLDCRADADLDPNAPIMIGMDYNANINWIVAGQIDRADASRLNVVRSFYTKYERKIPELVADFCRYYAAHPTKTVVYYYDSTALGSNYAVNTQDIHWWVCHEFARHGWSVVDAYIGQPMRKHDKYIMINSGLAGRERLTPFFNRQNNEDLILALQSTAVSRGRNGFDKNKASEKLAESEESRLEHRTDGTDAFDTLYIGALRFPHYALPVPDFSGIS